MNITVCCCWFGWPPLSPLLSSSSCSQSTAQVHFRFTSADVSRRVRAARQLLNKVVRSLITCKARKKKIFICLKEQHILPTRPLQMVALTSVLISQTHSSPCVLTNHPMLVASQLEKEVWHNLPSLVFKGREFCYKKILPGMPAFDSATGFLR